MAKLRVPLISFGATGPIGKLLSLKRRLGQNIIESRPIPEDAKSLAQLSWRHMYLKAVALWNALSAAEQQEWETLARSRNMTGYAWFLSQALKPNPGLYLPLQGGTMTGDIVMGKNRILKLPAPTDDQEPVTKKYFEDNPPPGGYTEGARAYHSVPQTIPTSTMTDLAFDSERWDTDTIHDLVTNNSRLTCKTAGKYVIMGGVRFAMNATGNRVARIYLNATTIIAYYFVPNAGAAQRTQFVVSTIYDLAVDDYIELTVFQDSGENLDLEAHSNTSPEFMMQRIG